MSTTRSELSTALSSTSLLSLQVGGVAPGDEILESYRVESTFLVFSPLPGGGKELSKTPPGEVEKEKGELQIST